MCIGFFLLVRRISCHSLLLVFCVCSSFSLEVGCRRKFEFCPAASDVEWFGWCGGGWFVEYFTMIVYQLSYL